LIVARTTRRTDSGRINRLALFCISATVVAAAAAAAAAVVVCSDNKYDIPHWV